METTKSVQEKQVFTTKEAANYLGVHVNTIRNWVKKGQLKIFTYTDGGNHYIKKSVLDNYLANL